MTTSKKNIQHHCDLESRIRFVGDNRSHSTDVGIDPGVRLATVLWDQCPAGCQSQWSHSVATVIFQSTSHSHLSAKATWSCSCLKIKR